MQFATVIKSITIVKVLWNARDHIQVLPLQAAIKHSCMTLVTNMLFKRCIKSYYCSVMIILLGSYCTNVYTGLSDAFTLCSQ